MRILLVLATILAIKSAAYTAKTDAQDNELVPKVKLTLFYESYCPFSIRFIVNQLFPTTMKYYQYLDLDLVPFGHCEAKQLPSGGWDFKCQHGEKECYGNRVHACAIEQGKDKGNAKTVMALTCLMNFNYSDKEIQQCLSKANFSWQRHQLCMQRDSVNLELAYGKRTHENNPHVNYVPFVMFNDVYNHTIEDVAVKNLEQAVCELLGDKRPPSCPQY